VFLLVPAHPGSPGQSALKTVVVVCCYPIMGFMGTKFRGCKVRFLDKSNLVSFCTRRVSVFYASHCKTGLCHLLKSIMGEERIRSGGPGDQHLPFLEPGDHRNMKIKYMHKTGDNVGHKLFILTVVMHPAGGLALDTS